MKSSSGEATFSLEFGGLALMPRAFIELPCFLFQCLQDDSYKMTPFMTSMALLSDD